VYEKARYAPESDPFSEEALEAAQRDLRSLVGVATS